ncbi:MAG: ParB N-terminal domain-containing protein, partial [Leptospiraceae bacterium]|nr:ParB N-terminal domain-containing protein [Leptospiraceae bacterium]
MDLIQILKDKFGAIGSRDRSHLVRKVITNRKGHRQTVLVNPNKDPEPAPKTESRPHTGPNEAANPNLRFVRFDQIREQGQYTAKEDYDRLTIDGLKSRILQHGFNPAFPLQVDSDNGHTFNIVSGHHRYTAVQELISEGKLPADFKIPVVVRQYGSKAERLMAQVGENVRRTVNPLDEAKAIGELANLGQSVAAISEATGLDAGRVRRRLALNNLVPELQQMVRKKDRSLPVGIAEAIGMHGLNEDGSKNSTIQVRAHRFYNANRHRGFGASEVISYVQELKSQENSQFFEADSLRSDTETEALRAIGSQEKARRNSAQVDKFIGQVQSSFQKLLGDSTGSLNESTIKELATSLIASEGETGFKSKMDRLSALLTDLQSVKNTLEKNYNRIKEESQNHGLFFARSMALIESLTDQVLILKGKAAQVGEIRNWKSGTFRKTNEGWRRQSSASGGASGKENYQHALRSDANQTQKSNRIDLLNAIRNKVENLSRRVGKNSGATLIASSLVGEIETHGSASIIGRAVKNSQDLAATVSILRDPRFETLRAIVVQEGKIVAASDLSSRLPAAVAFTEDFYDRAISLAKKAGGGNLYLLHNHPSGDPEPSDQDVKVTKALAARLQNSTAAAEASQEVTFGVH